MAPLRFGVAPHLEAEADRIIKEANKDRKVTRGGADILTTYQEKLRRSREIFNSTGVAEPQTRRGIYGRSANSAYPHLNSTDGATGVRDRRDSLGSHVEASSLQPTTPTVVEKIWR